MFVFGGEMTCARCEYLDENVQLRTRGELFRAIGVIDISRERWIMGQISAA
jgi:hypothetical protein